MFSYKTDMHHLDLLAEIEAQFTLIAKAGQGFHERNGYTTQTPSRPEMHRQNLLHDVADRVHEPLKDMLREMGVTQNRIFDNVTIVTSDGWRHRLGAVHDGAYSIYHHHSEQIATTSQALPRAA